MTSHPPGRFRPRAGRALLAAVLALASLGGSFDLHGPETSESLLASPWADPALGGACHPELPLHVENGDASAHRFCFACLLRLSSRGRQALSWQAAGALQIGGEPTAEQVHPMATGVARPARSRAPPARS